MTATKIRKKLTPRTARTNDQVCKLRRDNTETADYWILVEETEVHIHEQKIGQEATARITIPKRDFNKLVDFYNGV